ncbi:MAG: hypothetical protein HOB14_08135 [Gammaproteobacteria bacterium]|nr:hypothetical protein [Gammaproteobacteria bacterium]MBT3725171.1 hypothetical protein [Gammaproteobacteria bacterium]MBT4450467.1 hypothetical protein [Gammaproteobacteria bacterium]MBT4859423.1 hypothetical protein [Gammaproteobacteria bacterium]MBT6455513.1 hypothetical protein [Gammaproteobacteria bacterium]
MSSESSYSINDLDVFPEEFIHFITGNLGLRKLISQQHGELFNADYWKSVQQERLNHRYHYIFPYSRDSRFERIFNSAAKCP